MFKVDEKTSELILLQRMGYGLEPKETEAVASAYYNDMSSAYSDIVKHIPAGYSSVLDIGCGIGGIDVLLGQKNPECEFAMLDRDGMESTIYYGFKESGAKYNYLSYTTQFMVSNGISENKIKTYNADAQQWPEGTFDVILSLISWGFHYPISTYLYAAYNAMHSKSVMILDIRHNSNGYDQLLGVFNHVRVIRRYSKCNRIIVKK